jgi:hypothetical protein
MAGASDIMLANAKTLAIALVLKGCPPCGPLLCAGADGRHVGCECLRAIGGRRQQNLKIANGSSSVVDSGAGNGHSEFDRCRRPR